MKSLVKVLASSLGFCAAAALFPQAHAQDSAAPAAPAAAPSAPAASTDEAPPPPRAKRGKGGRGAMNPLMGVSNVTDDQKAKAQEIMADTRKKAQEADPGDRMQIFQDGMKQVRAILTADQQKEFDANMARMRNRRKKGGDNGDAPPPPPPQN